MKKTNIFFKSIFGLILLWILISMFIKGRAIFLVDNINLIFHEAGHTLFFWAPELLVILGGTIMQLLIPILIAVYFLKNKEPYGISFSLVWLSTSLYHVGVYASDARAQVLPLLGDVDKSFHDWTNILFKLKLLKYDLFIGQCFFFLAFVIGVYALYLYFISIYKDLKPKELV